MLRVLRIAWAASLVGFMLVLWIYYRRHVDYDEALQYTTELREVQTLHSTLDKQCLEIRSELLLHYDPPNDVMRRLVVLHATLERPPAFLSPEARAELGGLVKDAEDLLRAKDDKLEELKKLNAQLRNSERYLPSAADVLIQRLAGGPNQTDWVKDLLRDVLLYEISPAEEGFRTKVRADKMLLDELTRHSTGEDEVAADGLRRHVNAILEKKPQVDSLTMDILDLPAAEAVDKIEATWHSHYRAALELTQTLRLTFVVLTILTFLFASAEVVIKQVLLTRALKTAYEKLERTNKDLDAERKRQAQLSEVKSQFINDMSHEFRSPLTAIKGAAENLSAYWRRWNEEQRAKSVGRIVAKVEEMKKLLDDILVLARSEAGRLSLKPARVDVAALCAEAADVVQETWQKSDRIRVDATDVGSAVLDHEAVLRVLTNLLSNAVKYSPEDTEIELDATRTEDSLVFTISDEGIGIPPEDIKQLYESFHRGRNVGTVEGTGVGLAVVKRLVERHGGRIEVDSVLGEGTTFVVTLPLSE